MQIGRKFKRAAIRMRKQIALHPYRFALISAVAATGIVALVFSVDRERYDFVSRCHANGKSLSDCECTYDARADMPQSYRPVADAWAHGTTAQHAKAKLDFHSSEFGRALMKQLATIGDDPKTDARTAKSWWSSLTSAGRRITTKVVGPAAKVEIVHDSLSEWMSARAAYGKHCRGATDRLIGAADDAKTAVVKTATDVGVDSVKKADALSTTAKSIASRLKDKVTGWWK